MNGATSASTSAADTAADHAGLQQAAQWYARLLAEDAGAKERDDWQHWLERSDRHRAAWRHVEAVSRRFAPLQAADTRQRAGAMLCQVPAMVSRRRVLGGVLVLGSAAALGWTALREAAAIDLIAGRFAEYRTGTAEIRELQLADATQLWLNAATAVDVDFSATQRRLQLYGGELLLETARDSRPFFVDTRYGRLRALGTRFSVYQHDDGVQLSVFDGAVEVRSTDGSAQRIIAAGQQTRFDADHIDTPTAASSARHSWSRGLLLADDLPLADFIAELDRYRHGHLGCAPEVAGLRVMGAYPLHDPQRALAMLEQALPVRVQRTLPWWTTVEARTETAP